MEIQILVFASVLLAANGGRITREAEVDIKEDECLQPPENTELVSCCDMPTKHILGHIRETVHFCAQKMRENEGSLEVSTLPPESSGKRKHYFRHRFHDGCFVQCLFEREGFLAENTVNKQALSDRIRKSFEDYEEWQETASAAVENCLSSEIVIAANETCKSGSAETFRCIHKELYMQCPYWLEDNEYCSSLKNFYMKCPNGPPPEVFPRRKHLRRNRPPVTETESQREIEN